MVRIMIIFMLCPMFVGASEYDDIFGAVDDTRAAFADVRFDESLPEADIFEQVDRRAAHVRVPVYGYTPIVRNYYPKRTYYAQVYTPPQPPVIRHPEQKTHNIAEPVKKWGSRDVDMILAQREMFQSCEKHETTGCWQVFLESFTEMKNAYINHAKQRIEDLSTAHKTQVVELEQRIFKLQNGIPDAEMVEAVEFSQRESRFMLISFAVGVSFVGAVGLSVLIVIVSNRKK